MKKNYFCSVFKAFGILPIILLSVVLAYGAYVANNPQILSIENADMVKGCFYFLFIGTAIVGMADVKSPKVGFIDYVRVIGFIGGLGAAIFSFVGKMEVAPYIYLAAAAVCAIELIVRFIFAKEESINCGFKQYNAAVANKFNPIILGLVSLLVVILVSVLFDKLDTVFKYVNEYGVSFAIVMVLFSLILSSVKKNDKPCLYDALLYISFYSILMLLICSFDILGASLIKEVALIFIASAISILLRGQSFDGEVVASKSKINKYYAGLYSKYDITLSVFISVLLVAAVVIPTIKADELNELFKIAGLKQINFGDLHDVLIYVGAGVVALLIVVLIIARNFKAKEIKFVDKVLNVIGYTMMIAIAFVVVALAKIDFNFSVIFDSIPFIIILAVGLVAFIFCLIVQCIRYANYQGEAVETSAEEVAEETAEDDEEFMAALDNIPESNEEEVIEAEEAPAEEVVEEVVYVDEQGNEINPEDIEGVVVEEAPAEEVVEEVVYVDEQGNEIDPDDVPEEIREVHEPEEEDDDDDDDDVAEDGDDEVEEVVVEVQAKERDIIMPEVSVVDENGQPKKIKRKFNARMMFASYETKEYYNEIKNYLIMYRAKGRNSSRCETFRYKGLVAKVALAGKSIKVCLAIDPQSLQGTKYRIKDVSEKRQYVEVPTMIKVRSARGLKYFKELVDIMMAARGVKPKKNYQPTNFMPSLIPNGEAILGTLGMSTDYLYPTMNARGIPAELPDDLADYLPVIQGDELDGEEVEASVYLDTLCNHFVDGDEITIDLLKEVHIVNEGNVLRIKARGTLDRKLIIYAEYIDSDALKMLLCTNCTVVKIVR